MLPCETTLRQIDQGRYRRLAGPFRCWEGDIFQSAVSHLRTTGARIATVNEHGEAVIWRLRSECETLDETESRLRKLRAISKQKKSA